MTTNQVRLAIAAMFLHGGLAAAQLPKPVLIIDSPGTTRCVDVSHDGKRVAAGGRNGKIFVWNAQTGKRLLELEEPKREVSGIRFTNGGMTLVAASANSVRPALDQPFDGRLTWWDLGTRKVLKRLDFSFPLARPVLSPDGKVIATTSGKDGDGAISLYDAATGKFLRHIPSRDHCTAFAFSRDSKLLVVATDKNGGGSRIEAWNLSNDKVVMMFEREAITTSLAISDDGKTIARWGGEVTLHRMKDGTEIAREDRFSPYAVDRVIFARGGKWLLGWKAGGILVFDGVTLKKRRTEAYIYNKRGGFALSGDGRVLATVGEDEDEVKLWRVDLWK